MIDQSRRKREDARKMMTLSRNSLEKTIILENKQFDSEFTMSISFQYYIIRNLNMLLPW